MARTALFSRLTRLFEQARGKAAPLARRGRTGRREFLLYGAAAAASSCGADPSVAKEPTPTRGVVIVGAGLAGLHCAYRLRQAGVESRVYEGNTRVGGRTFTLRGQLPQGLRAELGGEFIDGAHDATLQALALELGIALTPFAGSTSRAPERLFWIAGREVTEALIQTQLSEVAPALTDALELADSDPLALAELDGTPLAAVLSRAVPSSRFPELSAILQCAYRSEFGLEPERQSALNLIYLAVPNSGSARVLGTPGERLHAAAGTDQFATLLAAALGEERLRRDSQLRSLRKTAAAYVLTFETALGTGFEVEADRVVLALPFSVLRSVDLRGAGISAEKLGVISELGYGAQVKLVAGFSSRLWRDKGRSALTDLDAQQVWDGASEQPGSAGVLVHLLGGEAALEEAGTADEQMRGAVAQLEPVFPGLGAAYLTNSARRMPWPTSRYSLGGSACYRWGQWSKRGIEGRPEGNLHFCGEHTSLDFQGRMEGAAESGALVAAELLKDLAVELPPVLRTLVALKSHVPQPFARATPVAALGPVSRRRAVLDAHADFVAGLRGVR